MPACTSCGDDKPLSYFTVRKGGDGMRRQCNACRGIIRRRRYFAAPEQERYAAWRAQGIDVESAKALLAAHSGTCDLCGRDEPQGMGDWHVDHEHDTGTLRGLLCFQCNVLLGKVEKVGLTKLTNYLRRQSGTVTKEEVSPPRINQEK